MKVFDQSRVTVRPVCRHKIDKGILLLDRITVEFSGDGKQGLTDNIKNQTANQPDNVASEAPPLV